VNSPGQPPWSGPILNKALTILAVALAIYIAASLIRAVVPLLISVAVELVVGYGLWLVHRNRGGW
jgi:hypothetical protein